VQPDLDQSKFNTISIAGGRYFADEFRIATTFDEVVGVSIVPEPSLLAVLGAGLAGLTAAVGLQRRRRFRLEERSSRGR
jgi:MYXO-CTERM domain-containing protein